MSSTRFASALPTCCLMVAAVVCNSRGNAQQVPSVDAPPVHLSEKIRWISSAAWVESLNSVAVVDALRNKIVLVSPNGKVTVPEQPRPAEGDFFPAFIAPTEEGAFILKLVGSGAMELDSRLRQVSSPKVSDFRQASKENLGSLYDWVVAGPNVVGYGSMRDPERLGKFAEGFIVAPLSDLSQAKLLAREPDLPYYLVGNSYFTSIGDKAYYIDLGKEPGIVEVNSAGESHRLAALPPVFAAIPLLTTEMAGPQSDEPLYREIESLTMPVGLFGFRNDLYFLGRKSNDERSGEKLATIWLLYRMNPKERRFSAPIQIGTDANHVSVVVGTSDWYIFEKGPVKSSGEKQEISSMRVLPGDSIARMTK